MAPNRDHLSVIDFTLPPETYVLPSPAVLKASPFESLRTQQSRSQAPPGLLRPPSDFQKKPSSPDHSSSDCDVKKPTSPYQNFSSCEVKKPTSPHQNYSSCDVKRPTSPYQNYSSCDEIKSKDPDHRRHSLEIIDLPDERRREAEPNPQLYSQRSSAQVRLEEYEMTNDPHGDCIIFSNHYDATVTASNTGYELKCRKGTEVDEQVLKETFELLRFNVTIYPNCSADKMMKKLKEYASQKEQKDNDCFVCCILSHGYEGGVYGNDGMAVSTKSIRNIFSGEKNYLVTKPKLFFISACQGEQDPK